MMVTYLTPEQAANQLQVSKPTVLKWLRTGKLAGAKIGHRTWRIRSEALEAFVSEKIDDEPLLPKDWAEIRKGIAAIQRGEFITLDEYKRTRGL
jgi:excisionase family DNA binding protein